MAIKAAGHDIDKVIVVDHDICKRCGLCAKACTTNLLQKPTKEDYPFPLKERVIEEEQRGSTFRYKTEACANCRVCCITCPRGGINVEATTRLANW
jgi:Pyruvate/2-oxoacid:ferredoxin oxidoreductase delta subunit